MKGNITELQDSKISQVLELFNAVFQDAYYGYPMNREKLRQRLTHPDFLKTALVFNYQGKIRGFILVNLAREGSGWCNSPNIGFISLIIVYPEFRRKGIGRTLLGRAIGFLKDREISKVAVTFNPLAFWPGLNSSWVETIIFFKEMGFKELRKASCSMLTNLQDFKIPKELIKKENNLKEKGIIIRRYLEEDKVFLLRFIQKNFGYGWHEEVRSKIEKIEVGFTGFGLDTNTLYDPTSVLVILKDEKIIGFSMFSVNSERERLGHFGPVGIQRDLQGKGIGTVLLFRTLEAMKNKGIMRADLWTGYGGYQSKRYYPKAGFRTVKKWMMSEKLVKPPI